MAGKDVQNRGKKLETFFTICWQEAKRRASDKALNTVGRAKAQGIENDFHDLMCAAQDTMPPPGETIDDADELADIETEISALEDTARSLDPAYDKLALSDLKAGYVPPHL